jgi:2-polyprenyl-3-methyl-5-hydroxy-6-metoxy-1,4-benzoquinol methylase
VLIDKNYKDKDVIDFLIKFYEGRVDIDSISTINYKILKCNSCGFIWHNEILSDELMMLLYDKWISSEHSLNKKLHAELVLFESYAAQNALIGRLLGRKPNEIKVLDYGMGWGFWCKMADAFGFDVYGFEYSKKRIDYASLRNLKIIDSPEVLDSHVFDFINTEQVFEHVYQPKDVLLNLVNLLSKGGVIRISVPNGQNLVNKIKNSEWTPSKDEIQPLEHINSFKNKSLIELGKQCGLYCINEDNGTNLLFTKSRERFMKYQYIYNNIFLNSCSILYAIHTFRSSRK